MNPIERAAQRHGVDCTLVREAEWNSGLPNKEVSIKVLHRSFEERTEGALVNVNQSTQRWLIPAKSLAQTDFGDAPREGDRLRFNRTEDPLWAQLPNAEDDTTFTIHRTAPRLWRGQLLGWDVEVTGR